MIKTITRAAAALDKRRATSPAARLRYYRDRGLEPLRIARSVAKALWQNGGATARDGGPSVARQAVQVATLHARHGVPAPLYYYYALFRPAMREHAAHFLDFRVHLAIAGAILDARGADRSALDDKRKFARVCAAHGFPSPPILASFSEGRVESRQGVPPADLFSKPAAGTMGRGASLWIHGDGQWTHDGKRYDEAALFHALSGASADAPVILQERIFNHPSIIGLARGGVCTIRLVTIKFPRRAAEHLVSVFRMTTNGGAADNFAAGGMAAPVDARTGTLGTAVRKGHEERFTHHPDTGAAIAGTRLPFWDDAMELCLRAHDAAFPEFPGIGWDVVIAADGPCLLEGNHDWDLKLIQQPHDFPLGLTRLPQCYLDHLADLDLVGSRAGRGVAATAA